MIMTHPSVYSTQPVTEFQVCRTDDISLYAAHLYAFLESATYACPTRVALEIDNVNITYEELSSKAALCAAAYITLGIEPGDVIVFSMSHSLSLIIAVLGALKVGAKICLLPKHMSVLRLRAIQRSLSIDLLVHEEMPNTALDVCSFHVQSVTYQALISKSVYANAMNVYPKAFLSAAQVIIAYDVDKGFYPVEFSQAAFLKMLHEVDDLVPAQQSSERMSIASHFTKPLFLLELFYVFMRQSTAVFVEHPELNLGEPHPVKLPLIGAVRMFLEKSGWVKPCINGLELNGLCVSLGEIEYFAKQYPGVAHAQAKFSGTHLELRVKLAWDFYPYPFIYSMQCEKLEATSDIDHLALRLRDFLLQHMWGELPLQLLILEAAELDFQ